MAKIIKIVLAGGSCAGKTSAQKYLMSMLNIEHLKILSVPEIASFLLNNGVTRNNDSIFEFQKNIFIAQKKAEEIFEQIADCYDGYVLIICDRGSCDSRAFLSPYEWNELMKINKTTMELELNSYDAVFYLPSVAISYPNYYKSTTIRTPTIEMAIKESYDIYEIWKKHKFFCEIKNYDVFDEKLKELYYYVNDFMKIRM